MKENFRKALEYTLNEEGGYVNNPNDPGGVTNFGVTQRVWEEWVGHPVDEKTMVALTTTAVAPLYKKKYWDRVRGDDLPDGVDLIVFDTAVNSGPGRAIKFLQACVGVDVDGAFGPKTLAAVQRADDQKLIVDYAKRRLSFLTDLPTWDVFGKGWSGRVARVQSIADEMAA